MKTDNPIREKVMALLVSTPMTEAEISKALKVSRATCHEHARVLYRIHNVKSRLELVMDFHAIKPIKGRIKLPNE